MTKVEERIEKKMECHGALMEFLGADNVERLKASITDAIIQQVINDLCGSYEYIIDPEDITYNMVKEITDDVKQKIQPMVEKKLYERVMQSLGLEV